MILALDAGTSSVKALLLSPSPNGGWTLHGRAVEPISEPSSIGSGGVEQDPETWWTATIKAARSCLAASGKAHEVRAIGLSGQMQSVILCSDDCVAKRAALLYSDARAADEAAQLESTIGRERLLAETANWKGAVSVLPKLLWLQKHEPDAVASAAHILLSAGDYLYCRLTHSKTAPAEDDWSPVTDYTNASTTGLLSAGKTSWHAALMVEAGLSEDVAKRLPRLAPSAYGRQLSREAAESLGLSIPDSGLDILVCHGAGDLGTTTIGALSALSGAEKAGTYAYLGTSGWVACARIGESIEAPRAFGVRHPREGMSIAAAPMTTAGGNFTWLSKLFFPELDEPAALERINEEAALAKPDAGCSLLFLPYLNGERCPFEDPHARACWIGMGMNTGRKEMCKSAMTGVCFALRALLALLPGEEEEEEATKEKPPLVLVGGVARMRTLCQTLADVMQREVRTVDHPQDVGALGAAAIAAEALGLRVMAAEEREQGHEGVELVATPNREVAAAMEAAFGVFVDAHPVLKGMFARLVKV